MTKPNKVDAEMQMYLRERGFKKAALEKRLKRKLTDAEYGAYLINNVGGL